MQNGPRHEPTERIFIPKSEFHTGTGWKVRADGLLEAPDGRTEFPSTDPSGKVVGSHSYYLDPTVVAVRSVLKS